MEKQRLIVAYAQAVVYGKAVSLCVDPESVSFNQSQGHWYKVLKTFLVMLTF